MTAAMSTRPLAIFLHRLLAGALDPAGPLSSGAALTRLIEQPAAALQTLLVAHIDSLLATWSGGDALRPQVVPGAALWVAAIMNNLAWASSHPDPGLPTISLRLSQALPPARDLATEIAYHSLLRHIEQLSPAPEWQPVVRNLLVCSPLTAAWLPRLDAPLDQDRLAGLLAHPPLLKALRDRWLSLAPAPSEVRRGISAESASANAAVGELLGRLLASGEQWRPFALSFYEADCALQQRSGSTGPIWPLIEQLRAARVGADPRQRRYAERILARYRPLAKLLADTDALRPYLHLDVRFLVQIGALW